jgi:dephospho-CoA kinase
MRLIALTGLPRSGKDTIAGFLQSHYYARRAFADPLKDAAAILLDREPWEMRGEQGFDREAVLPEWGFSTRWFLQRFGTEAVRDNIRQDFWTHRMRNYLSRVNNPLARVVITDCRFLNEVELVHEFGGIVVEVKRPGCVKSDHISDAGIPADRYVFNDSTLEYLRAEADYLASLVV